MQPWRPEENPPDLYFKDQNPSNVKNLGPLETANDVKCQKYFKMRLANAQMIIDSQLKMLNQKIYLLLKAYQTKAY